MRRRQRLQTTEARGREDGSGGRRMRISVRRSWSSSGDKGHVAGEAGGLERRRRREIILTLARVKWGEGML
jgi:hypothetical protein